MVDSSICSMGYFVDTILGRNSLLRFVQPLGSTTTIIPSCNDFTNCNYDGGRLYEIRNAGFNYRKA